MATRKSTGKRLRFEVFKRDHFACQYCGAQPPDVVLVADHITAFAAGGMTTIDNLITACEACNQGKADNPLGVRQVRPDADLLYLETQQELMELQRYQAALEEKERFLTQVVNSLQDVWAVCSDLDWVPAEHVLRQMLTRYAAETVEAAIRDVAPKVASNYISKSTWDRYMWAVMRNIEDNDVA